MSERLTRKDFQALADMRFEDAQVLYRGGRHAAAYYMAGYAVECALKACVAGQTKEFDFPLSPDDAKKVYSHSLNGLLKELKLEDDLRASGETQDLWQFAEKWKVESRYDLAFRYLATHCRKRSLVVLVTSIIDEVNAGQVDRYLTNLVGRHLPLAILLRDHRMFDAVAPERPDDEQLWSYAAAADILAWRHQVLTDMQNKGVLALDVFPEQMTAPLVNRYLEIKARHLL